MHFLRRALPVVLVLCLADRVLAQQAVNWEGTLESAKTTARQSNRLVILFFSASWCHNCHRLESDLRNQPGAVAALQANYVPVKIDYDYYPNTAKQYGVTRLPTTIIIAPTASGDVLAVVEGALPVNEYLAKLDRVAADARRRSAAYAQIPAAPAARVASNVSGVGAPAQRASVPDAGSVVPASGASMGAPATSPVIPPSNAAPRMEAQPPAQKAPPSIGLDGYCPVQLLENGHWQKGDKAWGMIHRGRIYLFAGPDEQSRFRANPDRYAPVNSGNDVVLALDAGRSVAGFREHGAQFDGHVYLFATEETLTKFQANPRSYAERALQAIRPDRLGTALR